MALSKEQSDRAYAMAESWANDPERLYAMLSCRILPEELKQICGHLSTAFAALTDFTVSNERTVREASTAIAMIHGVVVERLLLPTAEQIVRDSEPAAWPERMAA